MSIGSAWNPTSAYERLGDKVSKLALNTVHGGEWARLHVRSVELAMALHELNVRNAALLAAVETVEGPSDRLRLRHELTAYRTYLREGQRRLVALSKSPNDDDGCASELFVVLMVSIADEYLGDALSELAAADGGDRQDDPAARWTLACVGDLARAQWHRCLTSDGVEHHSSYSEDTFDVARVVRHLLVHGAGIVTRDFTARFQQFPATAETRLRLPESFTLDLVCSLGSLLKVVDRDIANRIARIGRKGYLLQDR